MFIVLFFSISAYCECEDIAENIGICKKYSCTQFIGSGNCIEHKILGFNRENLCLYIEKQGEDEMVCHHSLNGMMIEKKYFESAFKTNDQKIDSSFFDIVSLRARECFFINHPKPDYVDKDDIIREAIENDFDVLSEYNGMKSIFFDEESVNKIIYEMEKFNLQSSRAIQEEIMDNFSSKVVSLDSILYLSPDTWKIWVNGKLFTNTQDLRVHSVTENCVTFSWTTDQKEAKQQINDLQNIQFGHGSIIFTLYPNQKFYLESLSVE